MGVVMMSIVTRILLYIVLVCVENLSELCAEYEFVTPLVTQISWTNHLLIMSKSKTKEERSFYIALAEREQNVNEVHLNVI